MIWPYKGEALFSQENFFRLQKSVCHQTNYAMKITLSDAESSKEHDATKYSHEG